MGLHNYHDALKSFPPAFVPGEENEPKHSWRVLALPYFTTDAFYDRYDMSQPWNRAGNLELAAEHGQSCPLPKSFPVALHAALHGATFADCVRDSIRSGGDTAGRLFLTAAIRGATDGIPEAWLARLARREEIERLTDALLERVD